MNTIDAGTERALVRSIRDAIERPRAGHGGCLVAVDVAEHILEVLDEELYRHGYAVIACPTRADVDAGDGLVVIADGITFPTRAVELRDDLWVHVTSYDGSRARLDAQLADVMLRPWWWPRPGAVTDGTWLACAAIWTVAHLIGPIFPRWASRLDRAAVDLEARAEDRERRQ